MIVSDKRVIKVCLSVFVVIFLVLFFFDYNYEFEVTRISDIDLSYINEKVLIEGMIEKQSFRNGTLFLEVYDDSSSIKVVGFDFDSSLNESRKYRFYGRVTYYKNELEVIVSRIDKS